MFSSDRKLYRRFASRYFNLILIFTLNKLVHMARAKKCFFLVYIERSGGLFEAVNFSLTPWTTENKGEIAISISPLLKF